MSPWAALRQLFAPRPAQSPLGLTPASGVRATPPAPPVATVPAPVAVQPEPIAAPPAPVAASAPVVTPAPVVKPAPVVTAKAPIVARPSQPIVATPAAPATRELTREEQIREAERTPEPAPTAAVERLRAMFADAVRQLDDEIPKEQRTPAFMTLVGQLAGDPEGRIRRPPDAARRAMSACHNEKVSAETLVSFLEEDPLLTQSVLARANSAYYNRSGRPCLILSEAITRQGRRSVHNVLLQQTLGALVFSPGGPWQDMVSKTWSHMVRCGPIARALAPLFEVDPEQAFALALLHDVGKLAVFDRIATLRTVHRGALHISKPALTRALRVLHEPLGGLCALGWGLGEEAADAIATHHREPVPTTRNPASEVIWLAEKVDLAVQRGEPLDVAVLWRVGDLSADPEVAQRMLDSLLPEPASAWA